jgi:hypothetical protein
MGEALERATMLINTLEDSFLSFEKMMAEQQAEQTPDKNG